MFHLVLVSSSFHSMFRFWVSHSQIPPSFLAQSSCCVPSLDFELLWNSPGMWVFRKHRIKKILLKIVLILLASKLSFHKTTFMIVIYAFEFLFFIILRLQLHHFLLLFIVSKLSHIPPHVLFQMHNLFFSLIAVTYIPKYVSITTQRNFDLYISMSLSWNHHMGLANCHEDFGSFSRPLDMSLSFTLRLALTRYF